MRKFLTIVLGIVVGGSALVLLLAFLVSTGAKSIQTETHHVVYRSGGTAAKVRISLSTPTGSSDFSEPTGKDHAYTFTGGFSALFIAVTNDDSANKRTVCCTLLVDGKQVANNVSSGELATASCSGSL